MDLKNQYVFYQCLNRLLSKKRHQPPSQVRMFSRIIKKRRVPVKRDQIEFLFDR